MDESIMCCGLRLLNSSNGVWASPTPAEIEVEIRPDPTPSEVRRFAASVTFKRGDNDTLSLISAAHDSAEVAAETLDALVRAVSPRLGLPESLATRLANRLGEPSRRGE